MLFLSIFIFVIGIKTNWVLTCCKLFVI